MMIEPLTSDIVLKYKSEIAQFYYENMLSCSCLEHFTFDEAIIKIEEFIRHLHNNTCIGYGVFQNDEIFGYIWAYPHQFREEKRMYINEIRIREDVQNKGLAKALLKLMEERAKDMGIRTLYIHAEANNLKAIKLYESSGYIAERVQLRKVIL